MAKPKSPKHQNITRAIGAVAFFVTPVGHYSPLPLPPFLCPPSDRGVVFLTRESRTREINRQVLWPWRGVAVAALAAGLVEMKVLM